jgi:SAM-dependent methyltransferase
MHIMKIPFFRRRSKEKRLARKLRDKEKLMLERQLAWDRKWGDPDFHPYWKVDGFTAFIGELADRGLFNKNASILDIGCGDGELSAALAGQGYAVTGIDFAGSAIERARKRYGEAKDKLSFYRADATSGMPFEGGFDLGIDSGTFHIIPLKGRRYYSGNMKRLIRPGGMLVMVFAISKAHKLSSSSKDKPLDLVYDHFRELFTPEFEIMESREDVIRSHRGREMPCYILLLQRKP